MNAPKLNLCKSLFGCVLLLLATAITATAETLVIACDSAWGTSLYCSDVPSGCVSSSWQRPELTLRVRTPVNDMWPHMNELKATDLVDVSTAKNIGDVAKCVDITGQQSVASLLSSVPPLIPTPPPAPTPTPVPSTGSCSVTVSWTAPTLNTDGTVIAPGSLIGYRVYYGTNPVSLSNMVDAIGGNVLQKQIEGLASKQYYFGLTARTANEESDLSNLATKTFTNCEIIPTPIPPPAPIALYKVKAIASGSRPATEIVLPLSGSIFVLGYKLGNIPVGAPCKDALVLKSGASEYHEVNEADVALLSPTYQGRQLVAVCAK